MSKANELRALIALAERATQDGTWFPDMVSSGCRVLCDDPRHTIVCEVTGAVSNPDSQADARYIAGCSPDKLIPLLTAAAEAMEREERGEFPRGPRRIERDLRND